LALSIFLKGEVNMSKQESQQPQYAPQPDPNAQYGPAPQPQNTPYEQQPVSQQYFAQPQAAPVQYVVMAESLKGVKGWLMFFVVCFVIGSLINTAVFFQAIMNLSQPENVISLIFSPVLVVLAICAVVFITMQKRLGKWLAVATIATAGLGNVANAVVIYASGRSGVEVPAFITGIVTMLIVEGLVILYFFASRRVKETLVN
jgi:hypothetical protein